MQLRFFKVETLLNNAFRVMAEWLRAKVLKEELPGSNPIGGSSCALRDCLSLLPIVPRRGPEAGSLVSSSNHPLFLATG